MINMSTISSSQINNDGDGINIALVSQHAAVRDALDAALPKLREMFDQAQLDLVNVDVSEQSDKSYEDQASSDDRSEGFALNDLEAITSSETTVDKVSVGLLDTFV